jgi:hypothetical protein
MRALAGEGAAAAATTMIESFPDPLSGWKTRFMGLNSNLQNEYVVVNVCFYPSTVVDEDCRGNNWDGLWIADDNSEDRSTSRIRFTSEFAATLTSLALDIGSHVLTRDDGGVTPNPVLTIYDKDMNVLLTEVIPPGCSNCSFNNAGPNVYSRHGVQSTNGIGGFDIAAAEGGLDVEGNVGIDNIAVTQEGEGETSQRVPAGEPATVSVEEDGNGDGNSSPVVAVDIPAGAFNEDVTVTVRTVEVSPTAPCHDFLIGQIGKCVEITAVNDAGANATLLQDLTVGICLPEHLELEIFKFENAQGRALPLQQVAADFLDCTDLETASVAPRNWLEGLALAVTNRVGKWITPKSAYAVDRGFGGRIDAETGLSTFTWASPIQLSNAVLSVNTFNSGKDVYSVYGTLNLAAKTFEPCQGEIGFNPASTITPPAGCEDPNKVIVAFGNHVQTINAGSFRKILGRWVYSAPFGTRTGILSLIINPTTGGFIFSGATATEGVGVAPLATYRPFSVQIGHRTQGGGLECGVDTRYQCKLQH